MVGECQPLAQRSKMSNRLQGPDHDEEERRAQSDEIDLRYRYYEIDEDEDDDHKPPQRRAVDGWSTESKSDSPWWMKAGIAAVSILIVLGLVASLAGPFLGSSGSNEPERIQYVPAQVVEIVDVRTIIVDIDGDLATVRYIGVEPLPLESAWYDVGILAHLQLVGDSEVLLEADEIDTDDFGRLLRYVYVDGSMVNGLLLRNGIASPGEERDGLNRHHTSLQIWTEAARSEQLGHWSGVPPQFATNGGVN